MPGTPASHSSQPIRLFLQGQPVLRVAADMSSPTLQSRLLPVLEEHFGMAAEFVLADILQAVPPSQAFDQSHFLMAFESALRREIPPGVPAEPILRAVRKALSDHSPLPGENP